jgi:hypothetical protein
MTILVRVQGQAADPARLITRLVIRQELSRPATCQVWVADPTAIDQMLAPGATITVAIDSTVLFEGIVSERRLSFGGSGGRLRQVEWTAHDVLIRLRHRWQERTFRDTTAAGVAAALVGTDGLSVAGPRGPRWSQVLQHGQDDLALLEVVSIRAGLTFCLRGRTLHLLGDDVLDPPVVVREGVDLLECTWTAATPSAGAAVAGWDAGRARTATGVAGRERLNDQVVEDPAQASALAAGVARRRSSQAGHLMGVITGTSALRVGGAVQVQAAHVPAAPLRLSRVEHRMEDGIWTTTFATREEDPATGLTAPPLLTIGNVTAVDDPEGAGRVRVSLPACGGIDGGWLAALAPGGGAGRGLMALPGVGDRVAVAYLDVLRSQGVILGGLWGSAGPMDAGLSGGEIRRYTFRTAEGRKVVLDDARGELLVEDPQGNRLAFSPSGTVLHSAGPLVLEAPGRSVTITGASIDFTSG